MPPTRKTGKRRSYSLRRVRVTPELALSTLAPATAVTVALVGASDSQYRAISVIATWAVANLTDGEGPVTVGIAHNDYTLTEIKECLEAALSISQGNKIANEQANRLIRIVGSIGGSGGPTVLNGGKPVKTRLNWFMPAGQSFKIFAWNESTGSLTTGARLNIQGDVWVKDIS